MISYKQWQTLNESLIGATFPSAITNPRSVGVVGAPGGTEALYGEKSLTGALCNKFMDAGGFGKPEDAPMGGPEDDMPPPEDEEGDFPPEEDEDGEGEEDEGDDEDLGAEGDFPPPEGEEGMDGMGGMGGPPMAPGGPPAEKPPFMKKGAPPFGKGAPPAMEGKLPPFAKKKGEKPCCDDKEEGEEKGKKLPPWLKGKEKSEAKSAGGFDPEGEQAGKVLPWLNRKGNHGAQNKKNAHEKLQKLSDKVKKEAASAFDDYFFASLKDQMGAPKGRFSDGLAEDALVQPKAAEESQPGPGDIGFAPTGRIFQLAGMADPDGNSLIPTLGESVKKK